MATTKKPAAKKPAASKPVAKKPAAAAAAPAKKPAAKKPAAKPAAKAPAAKPVAKKAAAKPAAAKAAPARKTAAKAAAPAAKRAANPAFMKELTPSAVLAAIVGALPLPRTEVVKKMWDYIKKNKLQDAINKRMINADEKLREVFGKAQVSMFEMTKIVNQHLK
jgi:chromatin remodeling complex protein RSC6